MSSDDRLWWYVLLECDEDDQACLGRWKAMHICAIVPGILSMLACIFIIYTAIRYRRLFPKFTFAAQIPVYIGICDLGYEIFHTGDHWHSVTKGYVFEGTICKIFGSMKPFWINTQTAWAIGCAVYLYRCIMGFGTNEPRFGRNNCYLHMCCWGLPILVNVFGFSFNIFGPEGPWCGIPDPLIDLLVVDLWMFCALITLIILYVAIFIKLWKVARQTEATTTTVKTERMWKVIKSIGIYPIAYFIQWFSYGLFKIGAVPSVYGFLIFLIIVSNSGGIYNILLYGPLLFRQINREIETERKRLEMMQSGMIRMTSNTNTSTGKSSNKSQATIEASSPNTSSVVSTPDETV